MNVSISLGSITKLKKFLLDAILVQRNREYAQHEHSARIEKLETSENR